ncbi:redoxin domain-containing protein [Pseudalkalibacillus hwajinpoensis]|uniref:redoxin domain-containing protein n=1 Tax=Guptibacillus hwajinpoensis TaxID=208199 RepID=UPI00325C17ED
MKRSIIGLVVLICLFAYGVFSSNMTQSTEAEKETIPTASELVEVGIKVGDKAPNFTLSSLEGMEVKLSDYKGKTVFVNFWATWCPPCRAEMPHMQEFYSESSNEYQTEILAVNITSDESSTKVVKDFVRQYGITFPVLMDMEGEQAEMFAAITIPTTYLIDKNGIIKKRIVGPMSKERMIELVTSIE